MKLALLYKLRKELNDTFFEGKLDEIPLRITRAKNYFGDFVYRPASKTGNCSIRLSGPLHSTEAEVRETLLHELIHQYLYQKTGDPDAEHGKEFLREASRVKLPYDLQKDCEQ